MSDEEFIVDKLISIERRLTSIEMQLEGTVIRLTARQIVIVVAGLIGAFSGIEVLL